MRSRISRFINVHILALSLVLGASAAGAVEVVRAESLEDKVARLERALQNMANLQYQIDALSEEVRNLRGELEEHNFRINQLADRQRDLYLDIDKRLGSGTVAPASQTPNTTVASQTDTQLSTNDDSGQTDGSTQADIMAKQAYQDVFALVRNKNYGQALAGYQQFLLDYPTHELADGAQYWIAKIYYAQQKLPEAIQAFELLVQNYPKSKRTADAQLKIGQIYLLQSKWQQAKTALQKVVNNYSGSSAEQLAKNELEKLKARGH